VHTTWSDGVLNPGEGAVVERLRSSAPCALMRITADRIAA